MFVHILLGVFELGEARGKVGSLLGMNDDAYPAIKRLEFYARLSLLLTRSL